MATKTLLNAIKENKSEVESAVKATPDWNYAVKEFDKLFNKMSNPKDALWSATMMNELHETYYKARDCDKKCANITTRTVNAMPKAKANDTKKIFLQVASACRIFHASHKINFDEAEIPQGFDEIKMKPAKTKGVFTYADEMPSLYAKTSLTFDYWIPKMLDWTKETREKGFKEWKDEASFQHESCTDFMRTSLFFLSDTKNNLPIAKQDVRQILIENIFDGEFTWIKKSSKREDIIANNKTLKSYLDRLSAESGIKIPAEAWNRILNLKSIK